MGNTCKLLIHVAQKERWEVAVTNAINFLKTANEGENLNVTIVANADSVTIFDDCDRELFDRMKQLTIDGNEIFLCENSLKAFNLDRNRLPDFFKTVPAAIRALANLQADGWIYVRP